MASVVNFPQSTHEQVVRLMSNLAEIVIKEPPGDIYLFAQKYFEELLLKRDGEEDKEYEKLTNCAKFIKNSPQGEINFEKINVAKKRRIDFIGLYRKLSEEKRLEGSNQDNNRSIPAQEELPNEQESQKEIKKKPQTPFKADLILYKSLQSSFEAISEAEEIDIPAESQKILLKDSQEVLIVNQVIQIYLPRTFATSFEEILKEKSLQEVQLIPYRSPQVYSVKFSILAWTDYGMVFSVTCGKESEVIFFLLKMPDEEGEIPLKAIEAIEFERKVPKFEVDSEAFRGFLMKFLDSFYPRGEYQQFTFINIEDPGNYLEIPKESPALELKDLNKSQESDKPLDQFLSFEKTLELLRIENDTGCLKTHQMFRPRSAPAAKVPKHLRQRVKSAK